MIVFIARTKEAVFHGRFSPVCLAMGILLSACVAPRGWALSVGQVTINARANPLGIAGDDISFAWAISAEERGTVQSAYQVRVGTNESSAEVWDSGTVKSDRQIDVTLPPNICLKSGARYFWQVKIWDGNGVASEWSKPAWFETGLLSAADWSGAKWISYPIDRLNAQDWTDYTVHLEFTLQNEAMGVLLRATPDARNGYMYQVNVSGSRPVLKPNRVVNGAYQELAQIDLSRFGFKSQSLREGWHTLEFDLRGSTVVTKLDGRKIDERRDGLFRAGLVGFRTWGEERAIVRRIKVTDSARGQVLMAPEFGKGESGFSGGVVTGGVYHVSGPTEAVFVDAPSSLPLLRGAFRARADIKSARVHASAHGLYQLSINGKRVGDHYFAPGWTDYTQRIQAQTYDVTALLQKGDNVIGAAMGDGWYRGKVGLNWRHVYGDTVALVAKLDVIYTDGSQESFVTDGNWRAGEGPFVQADLQDGENYDARLEHPGWDRPNFDASKWLPVVVGSDGIDKLVPQPDEPVRVTEVLTARTRTEPIRGEFIYDLGQNMVGVARIRLTGKQGQTVHIRYAEELHRVGTQRGRLYTDNFRTAKVTDSYTFAVDGPVTYQPIFTQHGFRYVAIKGVETPPGTNDVQGIVLGSDLPNIGDLRLSHPMLDQLVRNIRWGQRGNFLSIPTDTPARDERLGWTGDISVFSPTASRYQDTRAFLSKWMDDVRDAQRANGNIPAVVPQPRREFDETGVGWSDAVVTVPYAVWRATGDTRIVRRNWEAMKRFYRFVQDSATKDGNLLEEGRSSWFSGDWLNLENVDRLDEHRVIATAYFAENTRMMAEMAAAMGETNQAAEWAALVPRIRAAFVAAYRRADGSVRMDTQTVYAMALGMDLISDPQQREQTAAKFVEKLASDNYHLRTGFLGTPWLLPALLKIGREDLAMRLLLNEDYPSWGFEIKMGATTMWERWNSIRADGNFGPVDMNSFNHYAYGAVGDWMFQHLGGIQLLEPGYKKSRIAPLISRQGPTQAKCRQQTPYGLLALDWQVVGVGPEIRMSVIVPANTSAEVVIPAASVDLVQESNVPAISASGVKEHDFKDGKLTLLVGSGTYNFSTSKTQVTREPPSAGRKPAQSEAMSGRPKAN
jgi:alpha-L-rhamnosidase